MPRTISTLKAEIAAEYRAIGVQMAEMDTGTNGEPAPSDVVAEKDAHWNIDQGWNPDDRIAGRQHLDKLARRAYVAGYVKRMGEIRGATSEVAAVYDVVKSRNRYK